MKPGPLALHIREFKKLLWRRQLARHKTIGFLRKTMVMHVCYKFWYISLHRTRVLLTTPSSRSNFSTLLVFFFLLFFLCLVYYQPRLVVNPIIKVPSYERFESYKPI